MIDRGGSRGRPNKVKSSLGIVDWGGTNRGGNECKLCILVCLLFSNIVQLLLVPVPTSCCKRSNRWGNMCKLCILVCLPFWGPNNLNLSLATPGSGSHNSLLLSQPVQLFLCIVPTSCCKRSNRWGNMSKLCILVCLPLWGPNNLNLSLATPGSGSNNSLL